MVNEIRYEKQIESVDFNKHTIFLAGPTVRGNQPDLLSWRFDAVKLFNDKKFEGNLIIPEFENRFESDKYRYDIPLWEFTGLTKCHKILFWIPRTRELIGLTTNFEFGYWMGKDRGKIIYGRPDDAYRITYLDIMWIEDCKRKGLKTIHAPIYNTLEKAINASLYELREVKA